MNLYTLVDKSCYRDLEPMTSLDLEYFFEDDLDYHYECVDLDSMTIELIENDGEYTEIEDIILI